jgi:hypothetical protein
MYINDTQVNAQDMKTILQYWNVQLGKSLGHTMTVNTVKYLKFSVLQSNMKNIFSISHNFSLKSDTEIVRNFIAYNTETVN